LPPGFHTPRGEQGKIKIRGPRLRLFNFASIAAGEPRELKILDYRRRPAGKTSDAASSGRGKKPAWLDAFLDRAHRHAQELI